MIVEVVGGAATAPEVRVSSVDDLTGLHVAVGALTTEEADGALGSAGLGRLSDPDTAVLDLAALRAVAEPQATVGDWARQWDDLVSSAGGQGRVGDGGTTLTAHVEAAAGG